MIGCQTWRSSEESAKLTEGFVPQKLQTNQVLQSKESPFDFISVVVVVVVALMSRHALQLGASNVHTFFCQKQLFPFKNGGKLEGKGTMTAVTGPAFLLSFPPPLPARREKEDLKDTSR